MKKVTANRTLTFLPVDVTSNKLHIDHGIGHGIRFYFSYWLTVDLSIFYGYLQRHCSREIRDIVSVLLTRFRNTRSSSHSYPFQVSLPNSRNLSNKSSFIPGACNLWNVLPPSSFPQFCNLSSFKSKMNKIDLSLSLSC